LLNLDGAAWSRQESNLVESAPKQLFSPLPVLWVTANERKLEEKSKKEQFGSAGPCEAPVYKYAGR